MKKCVFRQSLLASIAIFAMMTLQSCQSCQKKPAEPCNPPPPKSECQEKTSCVEGEASEEAMTHVIEIDQPETPNLTEENSPLQPAAETPMEATSAPVQSGSEAPVVETISSSSVEQPTDTLDTVTNLAPVESSVDTLSSVSVSDAVETAVIEISESSSQE